MFLELHILQNFSPSNLNRDDTGSPKECEFGGYRRARISSQCFKHAMREFFNEQGLLEKNRAVRTKRFLEAVSPALVKAGKSSEEIQKVLKNALDTAGLKLKDDGKTEYLIFVGEQQIKELAELLVKDEVWKELLKGKVKKNKELKEKINAFLDANGAADIALFGRMIANLPDECIDAACQVAHAISTNRLNSEFDFYTAVDDKNPEEETGAAMMGVIGFNSSCFYRYMNIDIKQLVSNLDGNEDLTKEAIRAFTKAAIHAIPSGKQTSMAAQNLPSLVLGVAREKGLWSLTNAFEKPVRPKGKTSLIEGSIEAMIEYWNKLKSVYDLGGKCEAFVFGPSIEQVDDDGIKRLKSMVDFEQKIMDLVSFDA